VAFSPSTPKHPQGAVQEKEMKTSLTLYVEGEVVTAMRERHLNISRTVERLLRKELFETQELKQ